MARPPWTIGGSAALAGSSLSGGARSRRARRLGIRIGLLALAAPNVAVGAWLLFAPRSFYDDFPGFGHRWVGPLGAYDQHAFADFGGALLALGLLCCLAAVWMERRLVQATALAVLCQAFAHFVYHLTRLGTLPTGDDIANQLALAYSVVLSLWLLWVVRGAAWRRDGPL